jgi:hypothetical protein
MTLSNDYKHPAGRILSGKTAEKTELSMNFEGQREMEQGL